MTQPDVRVDGVAGRHVEADGLPLPLLRVHPPPQVVAVVAGRRRTEARRARLDLGRRGRGAGAQGQPGRGQPGRAAAVCRKARRTRQVPNVSRNRFLAAVLAAAAVSGERGRSRHIGRVTNNGLRRGVADNAGVPDDAVVIDGVDAECWSNRQ